MVILICLPVSLPPNCLIKTGKKYDVTDKTVCQNVCGWNGRGGNTGRDKERERRRDARRDWEVGEGGVLTFAVVSLYCVPFRTIATWNNIFITFTFISKIRTEEHHHNLFNCLTCNLINYTLCHSSSYCSSAIPLVRISIKVYLLFSQSWKKIKHLNTWKTSKSAFIPSTFINKKTLRWPPDWIIWH